MKKYFLFGAFLLCVFYADAQVEDDSTVVRRDSIPSRQQMLKRARKDYGPWMISVGGGGARWIGILPDSLTAPQKKFFNHLLWGYTLKGSVVYFLKFGLGFGFQYHAYHSSSKLDSTDYPALRGSSITEHISMQFLCAGIQYRLVKKNGSGYYNFGVGFGYFVYNDVAKLLGGTKVVDKIQANGKFAGAQLQASYNYRIDPHVSLGIGIGINNGLLNGVTVTQDGKSHSDTTAQGSLPHIDLHAKLTIIL